MSWQPTYRERQLQPERCLIPIDGLFNMEIHEGFSSLQIGSTRYHCEFFEDIEKCVRDGIPVIFNKLSNGLIYLQKMED